VAGQVQNSGNGNPCWAGPDVAHSILPGKCAPRPRCVKGTGRRGGGWGGGGGLWDALGCTKRRAGRDMTAAGCAIGGVRRGGAELLDNLLQSGTAHCFTRQTGGHRGIGLARRGAHSTPSRCCDKTIELVEAPSAIDQKTLLIIIVAQSFSLHAVLLQATAALMHVSCSWRPWAGRRTC
jgi:hypothetical protein